MVQTFRGTHEFDRILVRGLGSFIQPVPVGERVEYIVDEEDFIRPTSDATDWTETLVGAGATTYLDSVAGVMRFTTAAADDASVERQRKGEAFSLAVLKPLWFEARVKVAAAKHVESDILVGLCITDTDLMPDPGATNGVYFCKDDDDANIDIVTRLGGTSNKQDSTVDLVADTWTRLSFYWDGVDTVFFYIDDVYVGKSSTYIPTTELCVSFSYINGEGGATTFDIDYYRVIRKR